MSFSIHGIVVYKGNCIEDQVPSKKIDVGMEKYLSENNFICLGPVQTFENFLRLSSAFFTNQILLLQQSICNPLGKIF